VTDVARDVQDALHGSIRAAYVVQTERQKLTQSFRRERPHFPFPVMQLSGIMSELYISLLSIKFMQLRCIGLNVNATWWTTPQSGNLVSPYHDNSGLNATWWTTPQSGNLVSPYHDNSGLNATRWTTPQSGNLVDDPTIRQPGFTLPRQQWSQCHLVDDPTIRQPGFTLPRQQWSLLNRFRTGQGHCGACRKTWCLTDTDLCSCGET